MSDSLEDDPVVEEIPVYLSTALKDLHLFQFPLRPRQRPYPLEQDTIESIKYSHTPKEIEIKYKIDTTSKNYDTQAPNQLEQPVLRGSYVTSKTAYSVGVLTHQRGQSQLHVAPINGVYQIRPDFQHLDGEATEMDKADLAQRQIQGTAMRKRRGPKGASDEPSGEARQWVDMQFFPETSQASVAKLLRIRANQTAPIAESPDVRTLSTDQLCRVLAQKRLISQGATPAEGAGITLETVTTKIVGSISEPLCWPATVQSIKNQQDNMKPPLSRDAARADYEVRSALWKQTWTVRGMLVAKSSVLAAPDGQIVSDTRNPKLELRDLLLVLFKRHQYVKHNEFNQVTGNQVSHPLFIEAMSGIGFNDRTGGQGWRLAGTPVPESANYQLVTDVVQYSEWRALEAEVKARIIEQHGKEAWEALTATPTPALADTVGLAVADDERGFVSAGVIGEAIPVARSRKKRDEDTRALALAVEAMCYTYTRARGGTVHWRRREWNDDERLRSLIAARLLQNADKPDEQGTSMHDLRDYVALHTGAKPSDTVLKNVAGQFAIIRSDTFWIMVDGKDAVLDGDNEEEAEAEPEVDDVDM